MFDKIKSVKVNVSLYSVYFVLNFSVTHHDDAGLCVEIITKY